jgi:lysylphosphatidylglycerol synthetase-like protein (DUF2156 family)
MWDRMWLYIRLIALCLIVAIVVQMFIINVSREGQSRVFFWTPWLGGFWTLIVAFVLGAFSTPLYRASIRTWKEFKAERARQKDEQAEKAVQQKLGSILELTEAQKAARASEGPPPPPPSAAPPAGHSAADIWTSGEQDT